jgi:Sap-like sulfolipid-1-addressing protein
MSLLVLAFEAALYPTLLAAVVILLQLERPARLIAAYLAGGMVISVGLGLAIVYALNDSTLVQSGSSVLSWTADLALGGLVLLAAVALATHADERMRARRARRKRERALARDAGREPPPPALEDESANAEPWSQRVLARGSVPIVFLAALFVNVPGAAYLIALKDIAAGDYPVGGVVGRILLFNAIMFLLAEIPLVGLLVAPERTGAFVGDMNDWLRDHSRQLAIIVCATMGLYLVVRGLSRA